MLVYVQKKKLFHLVQTHHSHVWPSEFPIKNFPVKGICESGRKHSFWLYTRQKWNGPTVRKWVLTHIHELPWESGERKKYIKFSQMRFSLCSSLADCQNLCGLSTFTSLWLANFLHLQVIQRNRTLELCTWLWTWHSPSFSCIAFRTLIFCLRE